MGASEDITSAENVLRDLIEAVLAPVLGADWLDKSGLTAERLARMRKRLTAEVARRPGGAVEQRLIYYSDLHDLKTIIDEGYKHFEPCLGDQTTFDVYMDRLAHFRNAEMHGRHLLPFETSLTAGISGELRNKVTIFRSEGGPSREHFPRIESVRDSFGNVRRGHGSTPMEDATSLTLHPGDEVVFDWQAWDPDDLPLTWSVWRNSLVGPGLMAESHATQFVWRVTVDDIDESCALIIILKSPRGYHRHSYFDDEVRFRYRVLPCD